MPGGRVYVINSPNLVLAVQKHPKRLSFSYLQSVFTVGMAGLSKNTAVALQENVHGEEDKPSLFFDGMKVTHRELKPGDGLDEMSQVAAHQLADAMDLFEKKSVGSVELWSWINNEMTVSLTDSIYGPKNPFRDPAIVKAFLWV